MAVLGQNFWSKLTQMSESLGMNPEDLVAVMCYESGLQAEAHNKDGDASGLIQFTPHTLKGLGYSGTHEQFRTLDAEKQLAYVEKYVRAQMTYNGQPFSSATQYYIANLWPIALTLPEVRNKDPRAIIIDSNPITRRYPKVSLDMERNAYKSNKGLDVDKDGKITYGDLDKVMQAVKKRPIYQNAINAMRNGGSIAVGKGAPPMAAPQQVASNSNSSSGNSAISKMVNDFIEAVTNYTRS